MSLARYFLNLAADHPLLGYYNRRVKVKVRSKTEGLPQSHCGLGRDACIFLHMGFHSSSNGSVVPNAEPLIHQEGVMHYSYLG